MCWTSPMGTGHFYDLQVLGKSNSISFFRSYHFVPYSQLFKSPLGTLLLPGLSTSSIKGIS